MKKIILQKLFLVIAIFILQPQFLSAQGIYQIFGATSQGGPDDNGTLFTTKFDGTGHTVKKFFTDINPGGAAKGNNLTVLNNKLYTVLRNGGLSDFGIIAIYDPATNTYSKQADLFSMGARFSESKLTLYNGKLYGLGYVADEFDGGLLFVYDPATKVLTKKFVFVNATGYTPRGDLTVFNNKLYGVTVLGGKSTNGVIYEFDPATDIYTMKASFDDITTGRLPESSLIEYNGKLWGVSKYSKGPDKGGYIFSYDPVSNILSGKVELGSIGAQEHTGSLALLNNKLYGMSGKGGNANLGLLFQYDPATNLLSKEKDMTANSSNADLEMITYNGKLYGAGIMGGANGLGQLFTYEPVSNIYTTKVDFSAASGSSVERLMVFNSKMYFWSNDGGLYKEGALKQYDPATNIIGDKINLGTDEPWFPTGNTLYYKNIIYGLASKGGKSANGGIFSYDPVTNNYTILLNINNKSISIGSFFTLYNDKFYGVSPEGGAAELGGIFEFDPLVNSFKNIYTFSGQSGSLPFGKLLLYNNKFLGTTQSGGPKDNGTIFEFDPSNNSLFTKVDFDGTRGKSPRGNLNSYKGRIFGTATGGGINNNGTIFEYLPLANGLIKLADFDYSVTGNYPDAGVTGFNNKLYGTTGTGENTQGGGSLYEYDLSSGILSQKVQFDNAKGIFANGSLLLLNKKLYGTTKLNGDYVNGGVLFEYDPTKDLYTKKEDFISVNGSVPDHNELNAIPAQIAPGAANNCSVSNTVNINAANANEWIAFTDSEGRAIAEINANGNLLGNTIVSYYINKDAIRQSNGFYYLDRSITFKTQNEAVSPVSIRLYIKKGEFETLKTALSGNLLLDELRVFRNDDPCDGAIVNSAIALPTTSGEWATDYVFSVSTSDLNTFYFAQKNSVLPIKNIIFKGEKLANSNKLTWQVSSTSGAEFTLEKSNDGQAFLKATTIAATALECKNEFFYIDENIANGKIYYRLKIVENGGSPNYSKIIVIDRDGTFQTAIKVVPNPVIDGILKIQIENGLPGNATISVIDMTGKKLLIKTFTVTPGTQILQMNIGQLAKGIYAVSYTDANGKLVARLVKN